MSVETANGCGGPDPVPPGQTAGLSIIAILLWAHVGIKIKNA